MLQLINAYRFLGTRWAQLDPLKRTERPEIHELELSHYGFTEADLNQTFNTGSFHGLPGDHATLREILDAVLYGYQPLEVSWGKVGGLVVPVNVIWFSV